MAEYQENSVVQSSERLAEGLYRLTLRAPRIAAGARPGQFVMVACGDSLDPLLRRPFSIHQVEAGGTIQLLFKVIGRGSRWLAALTPGQDLSLIGPLGHGFHLATTGPIALIGGGIGIAPLSFLAHRWRQSFPAGDCTVLLGGRTGAEIDQLAAEFTLLGCQVHIATDDGSRGHHGLVTELLPPLLHRLTQVFTCGPFAMMAAVASLCQGAGVACETSLEAHMACGLGACLGCAVVGADGQYRHVCKHGPVFQAEEVAWNR